MASSLRYGLAAAVTLSIASAVANAQSVLLQIRPHVGDTLYVRLDQRVEMTGMPAGCRAQQGVTGLRRTVPVNCADTRTMTTRMEVFSRAIARNATHDATDMLAITDSVRTSSVKSGTDGVTTKQQASHGPVEIRISTDGGVEVGAGPASDEVRTLFGQMPATLSRKTIAVGEKWIHEMRIPLTREPGATGRVRTTFQLDSLGRNGNVAYISMHGVLSHDHSDGSSSETSGTLTGTMQLDRRLAWITETRATIDVWSMVATPASGQPMQVHTKVAQVLRVSQTR